MNILSFNKDKVKYQIGIMLLFMLLIFCIPKIAYADSAPEETIPDKGTFRDYIITFYDLDPSRADIDEQVDKCIKDYKNRYTMYVDIDYVLGDINQYKADRVYYIDDKKTVGGGSDTPGSDEPGSGEDGPVGPAPTEDDFSKADGSIHDKEIYKQVWDALRSFGLTEIATAGVLGNIMKESSVRPTVFEKYSDGKDFTEKIDNGTYTLQDFLDREGGYGLFQFTSDGKVKACYNCTVGKGRSLADINGQIEAVFQVVPGLKDKLNNNTTIYQCTYDFEVDYEKSQAGEASVGIRYSYALAFYKLYGSGGSGQGGGVYFQGAVPQDYSYLPCFGQVKYGKEKLEVNGAGPTAIAMVVSNLTMHKSPKDIAEDKKDYALKGNGSEIDILLDVEEYGLDVTLIGKDTNKLEKALKDNKVAIAVTGNSEQGGVTGLFNRTSEGNFIVITGINKDGTLEVHDPDGGNYERIKNTKVTMQILKGETVGGFYVYEPSDIYK